jgi:hypothetical protein
MEQRNGVVDVLNSEGNDYSPRDKEQPMAHLTVLNVVLILLACLAAVHGWRTSGTVRVGHLAGLLVGSVLGLGLGVALTPSSAGVGLRLLISLGGLLLGASILGQLGGTVGSWVANGLSHLHLRVVDGLLGAVLSGLITLLTCWVLLSIIAVVWPDSGLAVAARDSGITQMFDQALPRFTVAASGMG